MYCTTFAVFITLLFATALANDQEYWIQQAEKNAKKDLGQWPPAVEALVSDRNSKPVEDQIIFLQSQVGDSVDNMKLFVPKLISVVNYIDETVEGDPNFFRRGILHSVLWYIRGKRDNKSYYLLDGAVNWVLNRVSELNSKGGRATDLASKLTNAENAIAKLRDELDSTAQIYVKSIKKIDELSCDITENIAEIRALASGLAAEFHNSLLLEDADKVNDLVKAIIV